MLLIVTSVCSPPEIDFGRIEMNKQKEYLENDRIQYNCHPGYDLEGSDWITCKKEGWIPPPKCFAPCILTKQQLDDRNLLLNDGQRHSEWIRNGHTIEFTCRKGYSIVSPSVRKCVDGNLTLPSCNSSETSIAAAFTSRRLLPLVLNSSSQVICPAPRIENGSFFPLWMSYNIEDIIYTTCKPGYMLESHKNSSKCTKGGWLPNPKCVRKQCDFPHIENGALSWSNIYYSDVSFPKKVGQTIGFKCNHGFLPRNKKHWDRIKCTNFGWDPEPQCYKQCIPPKHLPHGRVTYNYGNTFIDGDEISFNCDMGYYPEHHLPIATCRNNDWFPTLNCVSTGFSRMSGTLRKKGTESSR
ncbi:complement factor H-related protein 3-like isoform X2 [Notechis scutatus]|uniref:Complement factor H-related protein 3-like isoform X2 n=1 Tax=Notechis scutatus TaxID=8663 RepID=A0A6J1U9A7_9SAUR|nr:complement factor H-related protein 3-like isoform X2 [Notechis scutatus]